MLKFNKLKFYYKTVHYRYNNFISQIVDYNFHAPILQTYNLEEESHRFIIKLKVNKILILFVVTYTCVRRIRYE